MRQVPAPTLEPVVVRELCTLALDSERSPGRVRRASSKRSSRFSSGERH